MQSYGADDENGSGDFAKVVQAVAIVVFPWFSKTGDWCLRQYCGNTKGFKLYMCTNVSIIESIAIDTKLCNANTAHFQRSYRIILVRVPSADRR